MDAAGLTAVIFVFAMLIGTPIVLGAVAWVAEKRGPGAE